MSDPFEREQQVIALRQQIEQTFANNPAVLDVLRANPDALYQSLSQVSPSVPVAAAIDQLTAEPWFQHGLSAYGSSNDAAMFDWQDDGGAADQQAQQAAYYDCQDAAIRAGVLAPQGWKERMAAGVMAANGGSWANSPVAQARLQAWIDDCLRNAVHV